MRFVLLLLLAVSGLAWGPQAPACEGFNCYCSSRQKQRGCYDYTRRICNGPLGCADYNFCTCPVNKKPPKECTGFNCYCSSRQKARGCYDYTRRICNGPAGCADYNFCTCP